MKGIQRQSLIIFLSLLLLLTLLSMQAVSAATVSAILLPGPLTITNAPVALIYSSTTNATDTLTAYNASVVLGVTDATGKKMGWHIQAIIGPLTRADGSTVAVRSSTVANARVAPQTGIAPQNALSYPRTVPPDGDTIFSAATGTGVGKSSLTFDTEVTVPIEIADTTSLTATLTMTVTAGP